MVAAYRGKGGAANDLVLIDGVTEDKILDCLANHHKHNEIYTYIGPVLISVNPYKDISGMYGPNVIKKYITKKEYENRPHVYALAERAYRNMVQNLSNECVVITGESGSGKTEASKKVMEYVAAMSSKSKEVQRVKNQLLESNPLLESFGNAKTVRNDNSSRFGKYMEILFLVGDPAGGHITTYLLEKSRVVSQQQGERNFHIFYEVLQDSSLSRQLRLGSTSDYNYLSDPGSSSVRGIDDHGNFQDTKAAMEYVGIDQAKQQSVFDIIGFLLNLGNVEFSGNRNNSKVSNQNALRDAADCLQVNAADLEGALTHRTVKSATDKIRSPLSVEQAVTARDAMAKAVYNKLFDWIVTQANVAINCDRFSTSIGVLDIYGFEILGVNGFEQLCINYTNEKLHQLFIELTLKAEQEEYRKEGIAWQEVDYYNNKPICDLVEAKRGIFGLMDDESIFPNGSDTSLFNKMKNGLRQREFSTKAKGRSSEFQIRHYAGEVTYDVIGMLERNKDTLFPDIILMVNSSRNSVASSLFESHQHSKTSKVFKRAPTTCTQYKADVGTLMQDLAKCNQHYIRCIKPNDQKRAGIFQEELCLQQVRYLGLYESVKVRRAGYAFRMEFELFTSKYKCVIKNLETFNPNAFKTTENILKSANVKGYEMGKTKLFIKSADSLFSLEDKRQEFLNTAKAMLPPEEEGLIYADKVVGLNEKYQRTNLIFCAGGRGLYWYNLDGTPAQFFPMDEIEHIGYNEGEGWMTCHCSYLGKMEDDPKVQLTYLSENIYSSEVKNFVEVMHSMGYDQVDASPSSGYPNDAYDPSEYKKTVKMIGNGAKPMVSKAAEFKQGCKCSIM